MSETRIEMNNLTGFCWCETKDCPVLFFRKSNGVCPGCWKPITFEAETLKYTLKETE